MLHSAFARRHRRSPIAGPCTGNASLKQRRGFLQGDQETDAKRNADGGPRHDSDRAKTSARCSLGVSGDEILMLQRVSARELLLVHEVLVGRWPDTEIAKLNP